jgi:DNA polymerase-4
MDMFYVAVELRDDPSLRGKPVVVGGAGARGVVAAASYEARRYGVFSAMASAKARKLCPHAIFLAGRPAAYREASEHVHRIFGSYTPLVEGIALDEAFLDVSGAIRRSGSAVDIAGEIRARVNDEVGITCSVGIAPNKFLAKIASKAAKPRIVQGGIDPGAGIVVVEPGRETEFLGGLPVRALWGVGPATHAKLDRVGVKTVGDLAALGVEQLVAMLGDAAGRHLHDLSLGRDDRNVEPDREAKSIGHEETFTNDIHDFEELRRHLVRLSDAVAARVRANESAARTLTLKIKYSDFQSITRSVTVDEPRSTGPGFVDAIEPLLKAVSLSPGVRLLGVSASQFVDGSDGGVGRQPSLFDHADDPVESAHDEETWSSASEAIDEIRRKFGQTSIRTASALRDAVDLGEVGERNWGPNG